MHRTSFRRTLAVTIAVTASITALAGCSVSIGKSDTLDTTKLEKAIKAEVDDKLPIRVGPVTCPNDVKVSDGDTFVCQVAIDDQELEIDVTQTDDEGNVDFKAAEAVIDINQTNDFVEEYATGRVGAPVSANCGEGRALIIAPGRTFTCNLTDGTKTATATVTVNDVDGNVTVTLD